MLLPDSPLKFSQTNGELLRNGVAIPDSNIYESLRHYVNRDPRSQGNRPEGHQYFIEYIKEIIAREKLERQREQPQQQQTGQGRGGVHRKSKMAWTAYR